MAGLLAVKAGSTRRSLKHRVRRALVRYRHLGLADADVLLASYPRSGSTWLRFMLFELLTGQGADFDLVNRAIPDIGRHRGCAALLPNQGRLIKTHELYRPRRQRTVYLARDVRAVLPSMYKQQRRAGSREDLDALVRRFVAGSLEPFGSWIDHVEFWLGPEPSLGDDLLLVRFEDLRGDPAAVLGKILRFIGTDVDRSRLEAAIRDNDLDAMKRKEREASEAAIVNRREDLPFVGSGVVEGWRELDARHIALVEQAAADVLLRLGYPPALLPGA